MELNPGPINNSLLYLEDNHRARDLWLNPGRGDTYTLKTFRGSQNFWSALKKGEIRITQGVKDLIHTAGFGGLLSCGTLKVDRCLLEALAERWRPETHTFHLSFGETTVTLQDVNVLWGLPIEGGPVTDFERSFSDEQRIDICYQYLGMQTGKDDFKYNNIKINTVMKHLVENPLTETANYEENAKQARCIILMLCGAEIFCDQNNAHLPLHLLVHMIDLTQCGQLSWGSAALACLYRNLCKATDPSAKSLCGPVALLQMWAWTRIRTVSPRIRKSEIDPSKPYGARWTNKKSNVEVTTHVMKAYRTCLQTLQESQFIWMPYQNARLPAICCSGESSWRSRCYLIYWDVVEYHAPERVMRQFGLIQPIPMSIPMAPAEHMRLHHRNRAGMIQTQWDELHRQFVSDWNNRHNNVVFGQISNTPSVEEGYVQWYNLHTVKYVTNPAYDAHAVARGFPDVGGSSQLMVDGLTRIAQETDRLRGNVSQDYSHNQYIADMGHIENTATGVLDMLNQRGNLDYPSYLQEGQVNLQTDNTAPHRASRGTRDRGRHSAYVYGDYVPESQQGTQLRSNYGEGGSSHQAEGTSNFGGWESREQSLFPSMDAYTPSNVDFSTLLSMQTPSPNPGNFGTFGNYANQPRHSVSGFSGFANIAFQGDDQRNDRMLFSNFPAIPFNLEYSSGQDLNFQDSYQGPIRNTQQHQSTEPHQAPQEDQQRPNRKKTAKQCGTGGHLRFK